MTILNETHYLDNLKELIRSYQNQELNVEVFNQKIVHLFDSDVQPSEDISNKLHELVHESNLSPEITQSLINQITLHQSDFTPTKIVDYSNDDINVGQTKLDHQENQLQTPKEKVDEPISGSSDPSLLRNILYSEKGKRRKKIETDTIIRGTYKLVSKIGKGGMGEVWKAIDLIQNAGNSRDPYVAIKFLSQEIQGHELALRALVREFARYKQLIHPNIVRAYELNRDEDALFIAMEYLPGMPLNQFIQEHPQGISLHQARPIIKGMCDALAYAHKEGIIHLDFKPSNVLHNTENATTKIIDFGIARLAEKQDRDVTHFDPGDLGAKSKAYATSEMMADADPNPSDDVYGLSCVIYMLLTGKHPFGKVNSISAETQAIKPKPIKGLNKTQFKVLEHGLAFRRKDRTQNVSLLYEGLFPKKINKDSSRPRGWLIAAFIITAIISVPNLYGWLQDRQLSEIRNGIKMHENNAINDFHNLSPDSQLKIVTNEDTGIALIKYYISQSNSEFQVFDFIKKLELGTQRILLQKQNIRNHLVTHALDITNQAVEEDNFEKAKNTATKISTQYPDSKKLTDQIEFVDKAKETRLTQLNTRFGSCLYDMSQPITNLLPCLIKVADRLNYISPNTEILNHPQLEQRFIQETQTALTDNNLPAAEKLISAWHKTIPVQSAPHKELSIELGNKKQIGNWVQKVLSAQDAELENVILDLLSRDLSTRDKVIQTPGVREKLTQWFYATTQKLVEADKFQLIPDILSLAKNVFNNDKLGNKSTDQLRKEVARTKTNTIRKLKNQFIAILNQKKPDAQKLLTIQQRIKLIDPKNNLLTSKQVSQSYSKKISAVLKLKQTNLAEDFFQSWRMLRPNDTDSDVFKKLADKQAKLLDALQNRNSTIKVLLENIKIGNNDKIATILSSLVMNLSTEDRKYTLSEIKIPYLKLLSKNIENKIRTDNFDIAHQLTQDALQYFQGEKAILNLTKIIDQARENRLKDLVSNYWVLLKAKPLNGTKLFDQLELINQIDKAYLTTHNDPFDKLSAHLKELYSADYSLENLRHAFVQWNSLLGNLGQPKKAVALYHSTVNRVALRSWLKAKGLRKNGQTELAIENLKFGLSLSPKVEIRNSLNQELNKQ